MEILNIVIQIVYCIGYRTYLRANFDRNFIKWKFLYIFLVKSFHSQYLLNISILIRT